MLNRARHAIRKPAQQARQAARARATRATAAAARRLEPVDNFAYRHRTGLATLGVIALIAVLWWSIPDEPLPTPPEGVRTVTVNGSSVSTWCEHDNLFVLRTGGAWNWFGSDSESLRIVTGGCPNGDYDR